MRKLVPALVAVAALAAAGVASADEIQRVDEPSGRFSGTYDCSYYTYDAQGNATKHAKTCAQKGYVAVYDDGVVACNGNEAYEEPVSGAPLNGYIWVGPTHAARTTAGAAPGNAVGVGDNLNADDPNTKSTSEEHGPCEDAPPAH
jgi:opacity protein-like surface antigen